MQVTFPDGGRTNGYQTGAIEIVTKPQASETYGGNAEIVHDVLMFSLMRARGDKVDCRVTLFDDQNAPMADSD